MPQIEENSFGENQEKYRDFRTALSDGLLSEDEKKSLSERYFSECESIHQDTVNECNALKNELELYQEIKVMSQSQVEKLQILSGTEIIDGLVGPNTFWRYHLLVENNPYFSWLSPLEVSNIFQEVYTLVWDIFSQKNKQERIDIQKKVGTLLDGVFWPNTFRSIMKNFHLVQDDISLASSHKETQETQETKEPKALENTTLENPWNTNTEVTRSIQSVGDKALEVSEQWTQIEVSESEKIQIFREQVKNLNLEAMTIMLIQKDIWVKTDGVFWSQTAKLLVEKYPNIGSIKSYLSQKNIPLVSDQLLPGWVEKGKETFRELYGEFVSKLSERLWLPGWFIEAIIRQETKYGAWKLNSWSGSKGMMQLTQVAIKDMKVRPRLFQKHFQSLDMSSLLDTPIWKTETLWEHIPGPVSEVLTSLWEKDISSAQYWQNIDFLKTYIKSPKNQKSYDHETNMILGSVYLTAMHETQGKDIYKTARRYNGSTAMQANGKQERDNYANNVSKYYAEITQEQEKNTQNA